MTFSPSWYTTHPSEDNEPTDPRAFDKFSLEKFRSVVHGAAQSNLDMQSDALSQADSASFLEANKLWFKNTDKNARLINHLLKTQGTFDHASFPDLQAAADDLAAQGLLDIEESGYAQHLDGVKPKNYQGATGQTYDSLESLIALNRQATLNKVREQSKDEIALEGLPIEDLQVMLKTVERAEVALQNAPDTQKNADAFLVNHPEFVDNQHNGRLIKMQLKANGVTEGIVSIEQFDRATNQLRQSGLLTLNKTALDKQRTAEVKQLAAEAVAFNISEEEMESLDMDELRRRADRQLASRR